MMIARYAIMASTLVDDDDFTDDDDDVGGGGVVCAMLAFYIQLMLGEDDAEKVDRIFDMLRSDEDEFLTMGELNVWSKKLFRKQVTQKECVVTTLSLAIKF